MAFNDQTLFVHVKNNLLTLSFKDKSTGKEDLKPCFEFKVPQDYFSEDHDMYIFFSANSGA